MAKKSLLEQAIESRTNRQVPRVFSPEEIELVEAWVDEKVTLAQVTKALKLTGSQQTGAYIAYCLRFLLQQSKNGHKK